MRRSARLARPLAVAGATLTVADALATYAWVRLGIADEGNPLLVRAIDTLGLGPAMAARAAVGCALIAALYALRHRSTWAPPALAITTAALAIVAGWHTVGAAAALT